MTGLNRTARHASLLFLSSTPAVYGSRCASEHRSSKPESEPYGSGSSRNTKPTSSITRSSVGLSGHSNVELETHTGLPSEAQRPVTFTSRSGLESWYICMTCLQHRHALQAKDAGYSSVAFRCGPPCTRACPEESCITDNWHTLLYPCHEGSS